MSNVSISEFPQRLIEAFKKEDKIHLASLFVIMLIAIAIRLSQLHHPMDYDESYTFINFAVKPLSEGLTNYTNNNNHLLHTFFVRLSYSLFGMQPWAIRLPAFLAGVLLIPVSYHAIRILYNKYAALLAASIIASSHSLIRYSVNARGHTLLCLFFLAILIIGTKNVQRRSQVVWFLFAVFSALGFYTIPTMLFSFGVVVIWLAISIIMHNTDSFRYLLLRDLGVIILIVILLSIMLYSPVFTKHSLKSLFNNKGVLIPKQSWISFKSDFPFFLRAMWDSWNSSIPSVISYLLAAGFFISLFFHKRLSRFRVPIVYGAIIWLVPFLLIYHKLPPVRHGMFLLILYMGIATSGLSYLISKVIDKQAEAYKSGIFSLLAITLCLLLSWNFLSSPLDSRRNKYAKDAEPITVFLKDYLRPGDKVFSVSPLNATMQYYFMLYNLPINHWRYKDISPQSRVIIVINREGGHTPSSIWDKMGFSKIKNAELRMFKRFETADLYELI